MTVAAGLSLDHVQIGQTERGKLFHHVAVKRLRIAVQRRTSAKGGEGAQTHPGTAGTDLVAHRPEHFQQQAGTVGNAAAVRTAAVVDAVAQKLLEQIGVGGVNLDTVETGLDGAAGSVTVVGHHCGELVVAQGAGGGNRYEAVAGVGLGVGDPVGGGHGRRSVGQQRAMGNAAHVPELDDDASAGSVHRVGDRTPGGDLLRRVDARRVEIALGHGADLTGFGNDQAGAGTLGVVLGHHRCGDAAGGAVARQRSHDDAIGEGDVTDPDGIEQAGHGRFPLG